MFSANLKIFSTLFLAVFVTTMGAGLVAPLLPVYAHELGAGAFQIGLIFGAFSLTRTIFVPYFGRRSDQKGRKPFLTSGLFIYFVLSILYAFSARIDTLILLRLAQGFASAMILPVAQAYVGDITPVHKEGWAMGLFNLSLYSGLSAGPVLGGVVKDFFGIRFSFFSMGALALCGFGVCLFLLPREDSASKNRAGAGRGPVRYVELVKNPSVLALVAFRTSFTTCIGIVWAFLPLFASTRLGLSSSAIGLVVMINVLVAGLFQAPVGYLADRFNKKVLVVTGGLVAAAAFLYLDRASSLTELVVANGLLGVAGGISFPAVMALGVIEGRRTGAMGSVMGLLALAHSLGMLIGPVMAGAFLDFFPSTVVFVLGTVILCAGTLFLWRTP
jgi:DHA1 family multidrug resistance protein-like MFS transporter